MELQDFKGIWIPKEICNLDNLCWTEKIILAEITMLSTQKHCYANNEHFSKLLGIRKDSASRTVCKLIKKGYLVSSMKYKQNIKKVEQRILQVNWKLINNFKDTSAPNNNAPICTNADTPLPRSLPPLGMEAFTPSAQKPRIEYNREYNRENNIYAQNRVPTENSKQDENIQQRFERFYSAYPKKKSKGRAFKWFKTHKPSSELVDTMIESLNQQKSTLDWQKENGRYIPYPASWLNSCGWENEIDQQEIVDLSENSVSRLLAIELYETLKNVQFTLTTDTQKLIKAWTIEIEKYLSVERTREREDRIFYAINGIKNSDKWRKIIVDAKSFIKNIDYLTFQTYE